MTSLLEESRNWFGPEGPLAQAIEHYQPREAQLQMVDAIAQAFETREHLIVEAGTGIGKSLAYLVPALLSG
ncbi:MAG: ATP-dependent DNA helicase, partial [Nevskiales bacterium]